MEGKKQFDFNEAVQDLLAGKNINGKDGVLAPLVKQLVEAALEAEIDSHITQDVFAGDKNRKNGKTVKCKVKVHHLVTGLSTTYHTNQKSLSILLI